MELSPPVCTLIRQTADTFCGAERRRFMARTVAQLKLSQRQAQDLLRAQLERGVVDLQGLSRRTRDQLGALGGSIRQCVIDATQAEIDVAALAGGWWSG